MTAYSDKFPWSNYYGNFQFFEDRMRSHDGVMSLERCGEGLYVLVRRNGEVIKVFICECYAFGVAEYMETISHLGPLNAIIINSEWCGYTYDVKRHCREQMVGIFKIVAFMAALNRDNFWDYLTQSEVEYFRKNGWL